MSTDRVIPTDVPTSESVIEGLRFVAGYHNTYGNSTHGLAAHAAIEALQTKTRYIAELKAEVLRLQSEAGKKDRNSVGKQLETFLRCDTKHRELVLQYLEGNAIGSLHFWAHDSKFVVNFWVTSDIEGDIERALTSAYLHLTPTRTVIELKDGK